MPETGLTVVATTYADHQAALGYGYDNVSGLAFLLFTTGCVTSIINVTIIVPITGVIYITFHNYFD